MDRYIGLDAHSSSGPVDFTGCTFTEIGRIGVLYFGSGVNVSVFTGNTYTGKGVGDWLDYAVESGAGANVTVTDNYISGNRGVASSDGSTSAGILVTTYFGPDTEATVTDNTITDNTEGIAVGYDGTDASTVVAHNNLIYGNDTGVGSTAPVVDALGNWWGDATGPFHATLNPGGQGNAVTDNVLFVPWMVDLHSVVSISPVYDITNCGTPITYAVRIDHGGIPPEVRGFDVQLTVPTTYVTVVTPTFGADFTEGSVLDPIGTTYFAAVDNGGGVYTVSGAILGGTEGSTLSGDLFYVTLTPTTVEGTGAIGLSGLLLRDPANVPLPGGVVGGDVQVDCTDPTMEWPLAELENECYNTAPSFSIFGFDDDVALDAAEYQIDAGGWVTIFSAYGLPSWDDDGWTLPGFSGLSDGAHTVYFRVSDMAGNSNGEGSPDTYSWAFIKDTEAPAFPTDFVAAPGNQKVHLSWTNPTGDASFVGVEIRRVGWEDYPEYATGTPVVPAPDYPANETEGTLVVQTALEAYDDDPVAPRDIYYYTAFAYDCAGNYSVYDAAASDRATNYWLGDLDLSGTVTTPDLITFSGTYGTIDGGAGFVAEADFGPTDDWSRFGIPLPDNIIQFEDLMIFA
ncbi:MAG: right-handed parallel beta-helix repeat-containing protein, partial [Candidatus Krumholzibacteria bacterium]|nr:right-handed parallel beta-helix repeat-containing protein [Candidatus Krumholzibacteria bacterium]